MSALKQEIAQNRPFASHAEEALLNLLRTADCMERAMQRSTRRWHITATQYNVLRILRGAHPQGLTCSAIGERMIAADPDITRLLSRLKALKFIRQKRDTRDKRVVWTHISDAGLALLAEMDETVSRAPSQMLGHLSETELRELIRLLELARSESGDTTQPSCDGANSPTCDGRAPASAVTSPDH